MALVEVKAPDIGDFKEVEVIELRELLRLGDALGESVPGHDGLNGRERVAA